MIVLDGGEFGARSSVGGSTVHARATCPDWLFTLQETVAYHLNTYFPQNQPLSWSGPMQAGHLPPNISFARVVPVKPMGQDFLLLRLKGDRLQRMARDRIHFGLVLPDPSDATESPRLSDTGQTVWPQVLHRMAYTVRAVDPDAGWIETAIFVHAGGWVCEFAEHVATGTQVALTGPGGGGIPSAKHLLIGGDETAYPAITRVIAAQSAETQIDCYLFGDRVSYDFPDHPGLAVTDDPKGEARLAAQLAAAPPRRSHLVRDREKPPETVKPSR